MTNKLTLCAVLFLTLTGCASITGSKNQPIAITAICEAEQVQAANCTVTNDKGCPTSSSVRQIGVLD